VQKFKIFITKTQEGAELPPSAKALGFRSVNRMKKHLFALTAACSLFAANDLAPPQNLQKARPRILPEEEKNSQFLVSGDFLYWIPEMENFNYVNQSFPTEVKQVNQITKQVETTTSYKPRPLEIKGAWEPGLRLSLGYLFDEKGWDAGLIWTYFKNDSVSEAKSKPEQKLSPIPLPTGTSYASSIDKATGKWNLNQNMGDLEVGRNFLVGEEFHARPFFGIRGARIENKETLLYTSQFLNTHVSIKSRFWGAGPRVGASAAYEMGKGIGIFALGSGSLLAGTIDSSPEKSAGIHTVTSLQIEIGCQWKRTFQNKYHLGLQAAWEQNFFSGVSRPLVQLQQKGHLTGYDDLALKGLTASCHLNF